MFHNLCHLKSNRVGGGGIWPYWERVDGGGDCDCARIWQAAKRRQIEYKAMEGFFIQSIDFAPSETWSICWSRDMFIEWKSTNSICHDSVLS